MFLVLVFLIIPAAIYQGMSERGQSLTRHWVVAILAACFLIVFLRVMREIRAFGAVTRVADHHWHSGQRADEFQRALINHLRNAGWDILWSRIVTPDRVGFAIEKHRRRAVLLCLAPHSRMLDQDFRQAGLWQAEALAHNAAMVTDAGQATARLPRDGERPTAILNYDALKNMAAFAETVP